MWEIMLDVKKIREMCHPPQLNTDDKGPKSSGDKVSPLSDGAEIKCLKTSTYVQCSLVINQTKSGSIIHFLVTGISPETTKSYF